MFDLLSTQTLVTLHKEWLERNQTPHRFKYESLAITPQAAYAHSQQPSPTKWWRVLRRKLEGVFNG